MCGIIGIVSPDPVLKLMSVGMHAQQHRGKESAGIAFVTSVNDVNNVNEMIVFRQMGFVNELFQKYNILDKHDFGTRAAIGHVRYSTTGSSALINAHPISSKCKFGEIAIVHNGNITNVASLKERCNASNPIVCQTEIDTEIILHLIAQSKKETLDEALLDAVRRLEGAFSFLLLSEDALYAVRDPHEFRGLAIGRIGYTKDSPYVFASETVALDAVGAEYVREIGAGEVVKINFRRIRLETLMRSGVDTPEVSCSHCSFEPVYLQSPASRHMCSETEEVYSVRKRFGNELGKHFCYRFFTDMGNKLYDPLPDIVMPVPDSGNPAAIGFAYASGIPFETGIIRDHYSTRTFMSPEQKTREDGVRTKFRATPLFLKDKRVVIVDDSLVRGTTLKWVISELLKRQCKAKEVHVCIASPPLLHPCFYGIDMKSHAELIAAQKTEKEICDFIGADSLTYLPQELFEKALGGYEKPWCLGCFNGEYPIPIKD